MLQALCIRTGLNDVSSRCCAWTHQQDRCFSSNCEEGLLLLCIIVIIAAGVLLVK